MRIRGVYITVVLFALVSSCADQSGFNGGGSSKKDPPQPTASVAPASQPQSPGPTTQPAEQDPMPLRPEQVVDGQEVYNDCGQCLVRAQQLSQQIGFTADMSRSVNMGFYKIEPSRNLCDVHFLADMRVPIDDHNGVDTVGNNQIILYCPCACGYAENRGSGSGGWPPLFLTGDKDPVSSATHQH